MRPSGKPSTFLDCRRVTPRGPRTTPPRTHWCILGFAPPHPHSIPSTQRKKQRIHARILGVKRYRAARRAAALAGLNLDRHKASHDAIRRALATPRVSNSPRR